MELAGNILLYDRTKEGNKTLVSYVNGKIKRLYEEEEYDTSMQSYIDNFVFPIITGTHFFVDYSGDMPELIDGMKMTKKLSIVPEKGLYVHVCNKDFDMDNLTSEVKSVARIEGEICVTDLIDNHFSTRKNVIALIFEGIPTHRFNWDCWSVVVEKGQYAGRRIATRDYDYAAIRNESWLIPMNCKLWGIAYNLSDIDSKTVEKTAMRLGCHSLRCFDSLYDDEFDEPNDEE